MPFKEKITLNELYQKISSYNLIHNYKKLKKRELEILLQKLIKYKNNIQNDYHFFNFSNKIITLTEEQYKIVTSNVNEHQRIIACAGSGKTTTIVCRIKYLIDKGINPSSIMLTTFNVDAAKCMKDKIEEVFGFMPCIEVGTLDSIACKFYHKYFKQSYDISISEYGIHLLNYLKEGNNKLLGKFKYIFIDEFQDVNKIQYGCLKQFYYDDATICVIGDDAQNIYSFRGSNMKYLLNINHFIPNIKTYKLSNNYRSTKEIINLSNASILYNVEQIKKIMIPNVISNNILPKVQYFNNNNDQNNQIIQEIIQYKNKYFDNIAILSRNNSHLRYIEEHIESYNKINNNKIKYVSLINDMNNNVKPIIKPNHIILTSIHRAKGLEWNVVYIIGCSDDQFPAETDKITIEEERRLFYVACTRAKHILNIYFSGNDKNNNIKLTRFVQELPKELYNYVNYDKNKFNYNDDRGDKFKYGVMDTIKLLKDTDIDYLRKENIIPINTCAIIKIHDSHTINEYINQYYLHAEFGEYIDRFICRNIGILNNKSNGLEDYSTKIILCVHKFTTNELSLLMKYKSIMDNHYDEIINKCNYTYGFIKTLINEEYNINHFINLIYKIIKLCKKNKIEVYHLLNSVTSNVMYPKYYIDKLNKSFIKYNNCNYIKPDINKHIFKISTSNTILSGRRRFIYKNVFNEINEHNDHLLNDIQNKYIPSLNATNNEILCKKFIFSQKFKLCGEIDLIHITDNKIIDIKCSQSIGFQLEWLLQLLAYLAIIQYENNHYKYNITSLEIYNCLSGEIYNINVTNWNYSKEYLQYLYQIRIDLQNRNLHHNEDYYNEIYPIEYSN